MRKLRFVVCVVFFPLTIWYAVVVSLRNWMYDRGVLKSYRASVRTIGVGNLIMGGSGKTPHTEWLLRRLGQSRSVALLSRGYGRKTQGFVLADSKSTAAEIGDEPDMIRRKFPHITVAACEERRIGLQQLQALPEPPQIVVLDDVFQHRQVRPDTSILLTEYGHPWCDDHILPFGNLREWRRGSQRADLVIVTKCPPTMSEKEQMQFRQRLRLRASQKLYFSTIEYKEPQPLFENNNTAKLEEVDEVLLVTGIAHPETLERHLAAHTHVTPLRFGDHHDFSKADIQQIQEKYAQLSGTRKAIISTEKDASRLRYWNTALQGLPILIVPIEVRFLGNEPKV